VRGGSAAPAKSWWVCVRASATSNSLRPSELVTLVVERSLADRGSSIVVTTSLAANVLRIEVDQIVARLAAPAHAGKLTGEAVIRAISDRCSDMDRVPFQTWVRSTCNRAR
jgi:hypothetical protein